MTVGELINELQKYGKTQKVMLYSHGNANEPDEILGCFEEEIFNEDDGIMEKVVSLH